MKQTLKYQLKSDGRTKKLTFIGDNWYFMCFFWSGVKREFCHAENDCISHNSNQVIQFPQLPLEANYSLKFYVLNKASDV